MSKLFKKDLINIAIVDKKAYWVHDNTFYVAEVDDNGRIDTDNAQPIDVFSLSKKQAANLLKILDSLKD